MVKEFTATRGKRELSEDEFKAHLALCTRLEHVGVFLGAGSSAAVGGGTMESLWSDFKSTSAASLGWLSDEAFLTAPHGETEDVEALLDSLELSRMESWRTSDSHRVEVLDVHRAELRRAVLRAAILKPKYWVSPETVAAAGGMGSHVLLLAKLIANRQPGQAAPWVFTTNYDLAIEWAAESLGLQLSNGFSGLHLRRFNPSSYDLTYTHATARGEARFGTYNLYLGKLHGSLSWKLLPDGSVSEVPSAAQWPALEAFLNGTTSDWPGLLIFPGAAKFVQTTGFVYGEVVRRLTEFISRPNAALVISGYGFRDDHLNRILLSALQNPTMQLVVYLPELAQRLPLPGHPLPAKPFVPGSAAHHLLGRGLPQVTVVGHGSRSYFDRLVEDLPEAALLDDHASAARQLQRIIQRMEGKAKDGAGDQ